MNRRTRKSAHRGRGIAGGRTGHGLVALLGSVGLAVGVTTYLAIPASTAEGQPETKPAQPETKPGQPTPEELERQRLMKILQEEASKQGIDTTKQPEPPPATPPAQPPPAAVKPQPAPNPSPNPTATPLTPQPKVTDIPVKKDQPQAPAGKAAQPPKTSGGDKGARPNQPKQPSGTSGKPAAPAGGNTPPGVMFNAPGANPGGAGGAGGEPFVLPPVEQAFTDDGKSFVFNFTDETNLGAMIQFVQLALDLQIIANDRGVLDQKVTLMTPVKVPTDQILPFLTYLLEQKGYTMIRDTRGVYLITPTNQVSPQIGPDPSNSTQIIATPGIKPSSIQNVVSTLLNANRGAGGAGLAQPIFNDDLGVIIMTDTPNNIALIKSIVKELVEQQSKITITRFPVNNIASSSARDRILELAGGGGGGASGGAVRAPGQPGVAVPGAVAQPAGGSISNLAERLTLDPSSNALMFRGRPDETALLFRLLQLVDIPNQLEARIYNIGNRATEVLVDTARQQQLGDVRYFEADSAQGSPSGVPLNSGRGAGRTGAQPGFGGQQGAVDYTSAGFVVYPEAGMFIYRGTPQQHARVQKLIDDLGELSKFDDTITYEFIKLKHSKATELAQTVNDLLNDQTSSGNRGALLGRNLGSSTRSNRDTATERTRQIERQAAGDQARANQPSTNGEVAEISGEDVHVLADEPTNQVVIKAPKRLQPQLRALVNKLDLRRPQVFIEAKIIAVTTSEDFRLSVEVQQIIGQFALNTNFGLSSLSTSTSGGTLLDPKRPLTNLSGLTTALIRSKDVPILINAIQENTNSRILASPQVLVDDNEEATVESLDQQPTLTTTLGSGTSSNNTTQSFGGFEPAGPRLTVKPQISDGGYMKLEYEIELSSFTGNSTVEGVPPPKLENRVKAGSVTVPGDTTIVVGGMQIEQSTNTVSGIPLLKDIPLVGYLFRDNRNNTRNVTLYVFITPKIMRDPSFADLRLNTRLPLSTAKLPQDMPLPQHERIDVLPAASTQTQEALDETIADQRKRFEIIEPGKKRPKPASGMDSGS